MISPRLKAALRERRLRRCRRDLIAYTQQTFPAYHVAPHHREIADALHAVERGDIDRLIITVPPRHGKSLLVSQRFPAWYLGRNPDKEVIACSYGGELAVSFGRRVRNLMLTHAHNAVFPDCQIAEDSKAANLWHVKNRQGVYVAAGVGGAITGRGGHLIIIDDPVKSREEADSEHMREKVWDWYTNDLYTRLMPGGAIVVVATRWHEDDLTGRLLSAMGGEGDFWHQVHFPALDRDGGALWPDMFTTEALSRTKAAIGARAWSALYQGDPTPEEGTYFKREWFPRYNYAETLKKGRRSLKVYGASDYAVTEEGGDYTVHIVFGVDPAGNILVLDFWRGQTQTDEWINAWCDLVLKWRPIKWAEESGQIIKSVGPFLAREQRKRKAYTWREQFTSASDKPIRARSIQAQAASIGIYLPQGVEWSDTIETECVKFPTGKHDDIVDTLSIFGRMLEELQAGEEPSQPKEEINTRLPTMEELTRFEEQRLHRRRRRA